MKGFWLILVWGLGTVAVLTAAGMSEDPAEVLVKTWNLPALRTLTVRGQVEFTLTPGPETRVTVETTRALFDQLNVSQWFGDGTIAVESGLRGPRELGRVKIAIETANLDSLVVLDQSSGKGVWPGNRGKVTVGEHSSLTLSVEADQFTVETSWLTGVTLTGHVGLLSAQLRHQARVDVRGLSADETSATLDEGSSYQAGPTGRGTAQARHGSRVTLPDGFDSLGATASGTLQDSTWAIQVEVLPP